MSFVSKIADIYLNKQAGIDYEWSHVIVGPKVRMKYSGFRSGFFRVEELPSKPLKRKLRVANFDYFINYMPDELLPINIWESSHLSANMSFDQAVAALKHSIEKAVNAHPEMSKSLADSILRVPYIKEVFYLEIEPHDYKSMKIEGKDFILISEWTEFKVYSPNSDFHQADPYYTGYEQSSAKDARKLFQTLKADPTLLKTIRYDDLSNWFKKMGINTRSIYSSWG